MSDLGDNDANDGVDHNANEGDRSVVSSGHGTGRGPGDITSIDELVDRLESPVTNTKDSPGGGETSNLEWRSTEVADEDLIHNNVILPKGKRGAVGSKEHKANYAAATEALEVKFGVMMHQVSSLDGEVEDGNETKERRIQEAFVSNFKKLRQSELRAVQYDMSCAVKLFPIKNLRGKSPPEIYDMNGKVINMFRHWPTLKQDVVALWQFMMNKWGSEADQQSSRWLQAHLYKSSTQDLRDRVDVKYSKLGAQYQGAATYLFFMLKVIFHLSRETVGALKGFLKVFMNKGTGLVRGESLVILEPQVVGVCTWLCEANALPDETVVDVLKGLTRCSVPEFSKLFDNMLQQAQAMSLEADYVGNTSEDTLEAVSNIMSKAVEFYHALCTAGKWHVNLRRANALGGSSIVCWNCGKEGCNVRICPHPKNQATIEANKKKWEAERNARNNGSSSGDGGDSGNHGSSGGGGKPNEQDAQGGGSQRKKWPEGVKYFDGIPMGSCRMCGTHVADHSTKFHAAWLTNPNFNLAEVSPTHPLVVAYKTRGLAVPTKSGAPASADDCSRAASSCGSDAETVVINKARASAALTKLERDATSPDTPELIAALRNVLSLN